MNVALYVRVSTEDQVREGVSLDMQRNRLQIYALARGWTVVATYRDEGASGKDLDRPGIQELLAACGRKQTAQPFEGVLVYKLDRLTRSVRDLADLLEQFDRSDIALVSVTESLDTTTATGRLLVNIIGSVAQWEREQIGERTKAAMQHKKRNGEYTGGGTPYGYRRQGDRLAEAPEEQRVISWIRSQQNQGQTVQAIVHALNGSGRLRRGRRWHHEQIRRIIREGAAT